jgi:small subunit ribosomal protein S21
MGQLAGEGEMAQVGHPHRVENAVEMIHLVLQDAGEQAVSLAGDRAAATVERREADPAMPWHEAAQIGDRQASLEPGLDLVAERRELGVDQHVDLGATTLGTVGQLHGSDDAPAGMNLGRGETDAVGIRHGLQHVVDQGLNIRRPDLLDRGGPRKEDGVAEAGDLAQRHDGVITPIRRFDQPCGPGWRSVTAVLYLKQALRRGHGSRRPVVISLGVGTIVEVQVRDNNVDQALRALKKKMQREGLYREMRMRRHYEKPSERRAREKAEAVRRYRKLLRKRAERDEL